MKCANCGQKTTFIVCSFCGFVNECKYKGLPCNSCKQKTKCENARRNTNETRTNEKELQNNATNKQEY